MAATHFLKDSRINGVFALNPRPTHTVMAGKKPHGSRFPQFFILAVCLIAAFWFYNKYTQSKGRPEAKAKHEKIKGRETDEGIGFSVEKVGKHVRKASEKAGKKVKELLLDDETTGNGRWDYLNRLPGFGNPESSEKGNQIVRHTYYTLCYSNVYEQALWVAYKLSSQDLEGIARRTHEQFHADPAVKLGSAVPQDYTGSGFDRGHLCPAGDMTRTDEAMTETFYMSNMSPQRPACTRGIWKDLEEQVRLFAKRDGNIYICTGPLINKSNYKVIGANHENQVAIPDAYYKVVLDLREPEIKEIAFIVPNQGSNESAEHFAVTVDEAERRSGLDFFPQMPDSLENALESKLKTEAWFKGFSPKKHRHKVDKEE